MRTFGRFLTTLALAAVVVVAVGTRTALSQQLVVVDVAEVAEGQRVSELLGREVVNASNEPIGTIDDMVIDRDRVLYAVLEIGGFLGAGGHLVAVPFESLTLEDTTGRIVLGGGTREALEDLPEFEYEDEGEPSQAQ